MYKTSIRQLGKKVTTAEVVVVGLVDSFVHSGQSPATPSRKLVSHLSEVLELAASDERVRAFYIQSPDESGKPHLSGVQAAAKRIRRIFNYEEEIDRAAKKLNEGGSDLIFRFEETPRTEKFERAPHVFVFYKGRLVSTWSILNPPGVKIGNTEHPISILKLIKSFYGGNALRLAN